VQVHTEVAGFNSRGKQKQGYNCDEDETMNDSTLNYYDTNAENFISGTISVDFRDTQNRFLSHLSGKRILDFGCGSGRDTKYFLEKGYEVTAIDGSLELCKAASLYTGIAVKQMLFQELDEKEVYDGIWACSSILHLPKAELKTVMTKMSEALTGNGIIYTSFKYGSFEGERNGRYFTDFTIEDFEAFISDIRTLDMKEYWITGDVRPGREDEKWLNLILQKTNS
jgi:2-polyprenyl-3-methyl-5-hydroxy-6-metoxy-1,4-benzoquinol methylase